MKIAVYGSLRANMGNHRLMHGATLLGKGRLTQPATMFSNGGFPILSFALEQTNPIVVEIYDVESRAQQATLDGLEGYPNWYNRTPHDFLMEDGTVMEAWIYHQDKDFTGQLPIVESGDWVQYRMAS